MDQQSKLCRITKADLEPVWSRRNISIERIAKALGVSRQRLTTKALSLGLPPRGENQAARIKADPVLFAKMWKAGVRSEEIRAHFDYSSTGAVSKRRASLGLPARKRQPGQSGKGGYVDGMSLAHFFETQLGEAMANECSKKTVN